MALAIVAAALASAAPASAADRPTTPPRLAPPRVQVIAALQAPPLVGFARSQRTLQGFGTGRRISAAAFGSRLYLSQLAAQQSRVAAGIRAAVPGARVGWRYRVTLNGLAVTVPARSLPRLLAVPGVVRLYPNLRYRLLTDTVPNLVGVPAVLPPGSAAAAAGAGAGIKIGIVDDGVDHTNPFLRPAGLRPPKGFPKGVRRFTSGKVIVARSFPPSDAQPASRLPFDRRVSQHGTHVAGIAAGAAGTTARPRGGLPVVSGLSGVAPRAWIGNYRGLSVADPAYGSVGGTAEIAAAVDSAVADGMDVLNLSLGGTETDPAADALVQSVRNAVRAGVVVVTSAGNQFAELREGSVGSPGTTEEAITVAATTTSRFFGVRGIVTGPGPVPEVLRNFGASPSEAPAIPRSFTTPKPVVDAAVALSADRQRDLCSRPSGRPLTGKLVLVDRGGCTFIRKASNAKSAGAVGLVLRNSAPGDPFIIEPRLAIPAAFVTKNVGDALRAFLPSVGGEARMTVGRRVEEVPGTPRVMTDFSSGGPTPFTQILKPDISAPGQSILSSVPAVSPDFPGSFAVFDGTSMASPAVAGAAAVLLQLHPRWSPLEVKSALMGGAVPAYTDTTARTEAAPTREGAGFVWLPGAVDPGLFTDPASLSFGLVRGRRGATVTKAVTLRDASGQGGTWDVRVVPRIGTLVAAGVAAVPSTVTLPPGGTSAVSLQLTVPPGTPPGDVGGFVTLTQGQRVRRLPYWGYVERVALAATPVRRLPAVGIYRGDTRRGGNRTEIYRWPSNASGSGLPASFLGPEQLWRFRLRSTAVNAGVTVESAGRLNVVPILLTGRDENSVAGPAGLPLDMGPISFTAGSPTPAAGLWWAPPGDYYVAVDSGTVKRAGPYRLRLWVNDLEPPNVRLLTKTVRRGDDARLRFRLTDAESGVDAGTAIAFVRGFPETIAYNPATGIGTVRLGDDIKPGRYRVEVLAADHAQSKDVLSFQPSSSNTRFAEFRFRVLP